MCSLLARGNWEDVEVTITAFGRVELDITKVPTSTVTSRHSPESFEDKLSGAQGSHPIETRQESERVDARNPDISEASDAAASDRDEIVRDNDRSADDTGADGGTDALDDATPVQDPAAPRDTTSQDDVHPAYPEEGSVRQAAAGKDPGPSSSFLSRGEGQLQGQGQLSQSPGDGNIQVHVANANTEGGQQPQAQQQSQGQDVKALAEAFKSASRTAGKQPTAAASYRTVNPATLAAAEAARDSVIKQIVFQLGPDGGKMQVRLDPPELGRLNIHMVVEKGAVLQLSIAAERPEVLAMLDKHIPELRQALTQQGLDLSGTDVQTSLFEHREHGGGSRADHSDGPDMGHDEFEATPTQGRMGYLTAEGLDFWV